MKLKDCCEEVSSCEILFLGIPALCRLKYISLSWLWLMAYGFTPGQHPECGGTRNISPNVWAIERVVGLILLLWGAFFWLLVWHMVEHEKRPCRRFPRNCSTNDVVWKSRPKGSLCLCLSSRYVWGIHCSVCALYQKNPKCSYTITFP